MKLLLEHDADPTVRSYGPDLGDGYRRQNPFSDLDFTTLHSAIANRQLKCVETLLNHCAATMRACELSRWICMEDSKGRSALALAGEMNATECVDFFSSMAQQSRKELMKELK